MVDYHLQLGINDDSLEPSLLSHTFTQHLAGKRPAGILDSMSNISSLFRPTVVHLRILVCLLISVTFAEYGQSQTFEIDNDHTSLVFAVSHSGLSYTYGRFNKCSGLITIGESEKNPTFTFTIDAGSIDTNNQLRDDHLKGPDFFDIQAFPKIEFRSVELSNEGDNFTAKGTLDLHGVEKDLTIQLTKIGVGKGPRGKTRVGFFSKFSVKRSDHGIKSLPSIIGNEIAITLSFEGILKKNRDDSEVKVQSRIEQPVKLQQEFRILEP